MTYILGCDVSRWQDDISTPQRVDFSRMISAVGVVLGYIEDGMRR